MGEYATGKKLQNYRDTLKFLAKHCACDLYIAIKRFSKNPFSTNLLERNCTIYQLYYKALHAIHFQLFENKMQDPKAGPTFSKLFLFSRPTASRPFGLELRVL
jgi:hypothetical protein